VITRSDIAPLDLHLARVKASDRDRKVVVLNYFDVACPDADSAVYDHRRRELHKIAERIGGVGAAIEKQLQLACCRPFPSSKSNVYSLSVRSSPTHIRPALRPLDVNRCGKKMMMALGGRRLCRQIAIQLSQIFRSASPLRSGVAGRKFYALPPAGVAALRPYPAFTMADGLQSRLVLK
jgi:hypothetical protein